MAQSLGTLSNDLLPSDNSISTKEFLQFEKTCEAYKDSDEEIKMIFSEIRKLSAGNSDKVIADDIDDVELILQTAENIAHETENLLKTSPITSTLNGVVPCVTEVTSIPQIKVTKPPDSEFEVDKISPSHKVNQISKQNVKQSNELRRKPKSRPFSAGNIDSKKRDTTKVAKISSPSKKTCSPKQDVILEELKDTTERVKSLELLNVQLTDDNKNLRKKFNQISEEKHVAELKVVECEKFIGRLSKEYENRNYEMKSLKECENKMLSELNKERHDRKNLTIQHNKDAAVIQDLQRQVREMELILKRKHPDSVSALIVASKSSTVEDNKKKLLEERISRLEQELKDKEDYFQGILLTLQEKFGEMKLKYENHIIDVERQLMEDRKINTELKNKINKKNMIDVSVQTLPRSLHTIGTQTFIKSDRASSAVSRLTQNSTLLLNKLKEDSYLVATIKGLQSELTAKQRTIGKINRETEELRKNLRNLQKEKEVLINLNPQKKTTFRPAKSNENILAKMNTELEAELEEMKKQKEALSLERSSLLDSLKRTNEEFILLKKKRIQDLHTLQLAHEKELMQMNMQLFPLQEEIKLLNRTVEILQDRLRASEDKLLRYQCGMRDVDVHAGGDNLSIKSKK